MQGWPRRRSFSAGGIASTALWSRDCRHLPVLGPDCEAQHDLQDAEKREGQVWPQLEHKRRKQYQRDTGPKSEGYESMPSMPSPRHQHEPA